jgi:hypothetical protein
MRAERRPHEKLNRRSNDIVQALDSYEMSSEHDAQLAVNAIIEALADSDWLTLAPRRVLELPAKPLAPE